MDLNFTPEELAFRAEIRAWVAENLPKDISHKVHNALRLSKDDLQRWAKILGKKGWHGWAWPKQFGDWIFCLVRTSTDGKPQTGISFLLIDMKSPGITVRPIITMDGEHEVNEVWFDNVEVPVDNLVGEENKGWTYAKFLLAHERTNIDDVNSA